MKKLLVILFLPLFLYAQKQPKLIVGIVADQMRFEMLERYAPSFGENGFNRLIAEGMMYDSCTYSYIPTYTAPGHATIFTGTIPSVHGILGNDMYLYDEMRSFYCVEDYDTHPIGTFDKSCNRSPKNLRTGTIGDSLKGADTKSKVIAISSKDRGAILPGGKLADAAYWMDENSFLISSSYYMDSLPAWVEGFHFSVHGPKFTVGSWELLKDPEQYSASLADDSPYESKLYADKSVFPYELSKLKATKGHGAIKYTPFANTVLTEFAIWAIREEGLGCDKHTDMLTLSYSATDLIGHEFGPQSIEVQDAYLRLDLEITRLIDSLDVLVGRKNYVLFLTSDHAVANTPADEAFSYVPKKDLKSAIDAFSVAKYGLELVAEINNGQIWLQHKTISLYNLDEGAVTEEIKNYLLSLDGTPIRQAFSRADLENCETGNCLAFKNAFIPELSGDIFYIRPYGHIERSANFGSTHGSGYLYDTHVPLLFFGGNVQSGSSPQTVHPENIRALLQAYLGN